MTRQGKAYFLGCTTVGLWSTVATACKLSLGHISPAELVLYSALTSCCVLAAALVWQGKLGLLKAATGKDWLLSLQLGIINPLCYYLVLFKAYDLLPAQQAQPLNYTWAITLSLLSVPMLGQRLVKMQLVAIVISYFGVLIISTNGNLLALHFQDPYGVFMALLSTVFWSFYWIFNTRDHRDPVLGLFMNRHLSPCFPRLPPGGSQRAGRGCLPGPVRDGLFLSFMAHCHETDRQHRKTRQPDISFPFCLSRLYPFPGR
jgi:drug/metabolite transporter (DMT)-like permease